MKILTIYPVKRYQWVAKTTQTSTRTIEITRIGELKRVSIVGLPRLNPQWENLITKARKPVQMLNFEVSL